MWRLAYRKFPTYETMVVNHSVNANNVVGIRWYELRNVSGQTMDSATPGIFQQGTFAPDSTYRWMGSIGMDKAGNIALGYSAGNGSIAPSIYVTGRQPGDSAGALSAAEMLVVAGTGSQFQTGSNVARWGDYSSLSIDPADDCTFYYTTEYLDSNGAGNWKTKIHAFKFSSCTSP